MKQVSGKEVLAVLLKQGFLVKRQKGSHVHLDKIVEGKMFHVTVPVHSNKDLNPFVFRSIARQAGYTPEEFEHFF
ncbi:type II toxin-antitoxin system HicA family toxin [Candidatus Micrarchaeota archaeon]|nr:type II toxin-antitoxin system HicA family toxin [Candidatus Micrarchaeota archaeon]